jgi:type I restriction enzyme S subunit
MWFSAADKKQLCLQEGDLLVSEGGDVGRSCIWAAEVPNCGFQNSVNRIRAIGGHSTHYLCYWMSTLKSKGYIDVLCNKSTIAHFTAEKVASVPIPMPSIPEQTAIATFLDRETAKIDALIAEQHRLIELLQEKRQAVISHAVTKGLNPDAPMKDSGIEWLGEVPEHWEVETVSRVTTKIGNGFVGPTRDILVESGVPYVQATHIKEGRVNFDGAYFVTQEWSQKHSRAALECGDVLIVQTGAGTGDIGLVSEQEVGYRCHALIIVRASIEKMIGPFLALILQSQYGAQTLESIQTGGMHPHLNCGNVKFVYVPIPPLEEQRLIVNHIAERSHIFVRLQAEAHNAISLLQERRSALISAAVTGQIDVRGLAESEAA